MAEPLIVITRARVKEGKLEDLIRYDREILRIIEANEPQLVAFHGFLNEEGTELTSIQVHPDTASMDFHMQVMRDNWQDTWSEYVEILDIFKVEYYGTPSQSALDMDVETGIPIGRYPRHLAGFTR